MACALASQLSRKAPGANGYPAGIGPGDTGDSLNTTGKYISMITNNSDLKCKRCIPTSTSCKISPNTADTHRISGAPDPPGAIVNSYVYSNDQTLNTGLLDGMIQGVTNKLNEIGKSDALNVSDNDICRQYSVEINRDDNGASQYVWCTISDETIKNIMDNDDINAMTSESQTLANGVISGTVSENFQNINNNKLNPQNLTFDDDIPMKVYYGLIGFGGIYLLYQLSKKYGIKLNLD